MHNLSDTVAVSANFVDATNVRMARRALRAAACVDPRAAELLRALPSRHRHPERALLCPRPRPVDGSAAAAEGKAVAGAGLGEAGTWAVGAPRCWLGRCDCDVRSKCGQRRVRAQTAQSMTALPATARVGKPPAKRHCRSLGHPGQPRAPQTMTIAQELLVDLLGSDEDEGA